MTKRRITVYLIQRKRRLKSGPVPYYYLRWSDGRERMESLGRCSAMTKAQAKAARARHEEEVNAGRVPSKRDAMTLGQFRPYYWEARARGDAPKVRRTSKRYIKLSDGSLGEHDMAIRYLIEHFGEGCRLDDIDALAAEGWHTALAAGKLSGARSGGFCKQLLSENTLRSKVRSVKAIFGWAKAYGIIQRNPFADFTGAGLVAAPTPYVPLDVFRAVCEQAPLPWRAMFGLCRLAGLRSETEAVVLPWSGSMVDGNGAQWEVGVDWDRKRIALVGGDRGGTRYRVVPIVPELMRILLAAHDAAPVGAERVVHPLTGNNLPRNLHKYIKAAGLAPWKKPYRALRSSCENDFKTAGVAEPTYLAWLGHSLEVSRKHYVTPTDSEFAAVSGGR